MSPSNEKSVVGWREWIGLPALGVPSIKAKVDTGARTSSLHAFDLEVFRRGQRRMVRFSIHPEQRSSAHAATVELPLFDARGVRPSSGEVEQRLVVVTEIELFGERWPIELNLTRRDQMGFRMLLGRQALRGRCLVDPGRSFLNGRRAKGKRRLAKKKNQKERHK